MGQLLVTLIVPPIVGLVTYIIVRHIWERDEFKCVLCDNELSTWTNVQFRLRQQPEQDRE